MYNLKIIITICICGLLLGGGCLFWCYKGYYPFNRGKGKFLHFWLYDNYHIAFNHSNIEINSQRYWCKTQYIDEVQRIYSPNFEAYDEQLKQLQKNINALRNSQYSQFELNRDNSDIQYLYDTAHILKDNYYYYKAEQKKYNLQLKYEHNERTQNYIKDIEKLIEKINQKQEKDLKNIIYIYCVKVL